MDQEEIGNINRPITSTEIETVIRSLPANTSPGPDGFTAEFYKKFRAERNAKETKDTIAKINKAKSWFFERINKLTNH